MKEGLQIRIGYSGFGVDIYIIERYIGQGVKVAKPVKLIFEPVKDPGEHIEPTLQLGVMQAEQFLQELAEALSTHGVKTDNDAKREGVLEATKYHLEDLRKLQGLKKEKE